MTTAKLDPKICRRLAQGLLMGERFDAATVTDLIGQLVAASHSADEVGKLRSALRGALSCWRYPQPTSAEKSRKDEIWAMVYPLDERDGVTVIDGDEPGAEIAGLLKGWLAESPAKERFTLTRSQLEAALRAIPTGNAR